jgi:hypothetical protein
VLVSLGNCCNVLAIAGHVSLLYTRSSVVMESSPRLFGTFNVQMADPLFLLLGVGTFFTNLATAFAGPNAGVTWLAEGGFAALFERRRSILVIKIITKWQHLRM